MSGSFLPSLGRQPKPTRVEGADMVMQSSAFWLEFTSTITALIRVEEGNSSGGLYNSFKTLWRLTIAQLSG
jgi:hypothetical protein